MRDGRLREAELVHEDADADLFGTGEPVDDGDARRIGERLEPAREGLELAARKRRRAGRAAGSGDDGERFH